MSDQKVISCFSIESRRLEKIANKLRIEEDGMPKWHKPETFCEYVKRLKFLDDKRYYWEREGEEEYPDPMRFTFRNIIPLEEEIDWKGRSSSGKPRTCAISMLPSRSPLSSDIIYHGNGYEN